MGRSNITQSLRNSLLKSKEIMFTTESDMLDIAQEIEYNKNKIKRYEEYIENPTYIPRLLQTLRREQHRQSKKSSTRIPKSEKQRQIELFNTQLRKNRHYKSMG